MLIAISSKPDKRLLTLIWQLKLAEMFLSLPWWKMDKNVFIEMFIEVNFWIIYKHEEINSYITVAIGNPERHVRKTSHRGSKQQ